MLRLYPPAYVVGRVATAPDAFEDLEIRAGDQFQIAIFMLHRNPRYWDDPGAFRPGRFAGKARPAAFMPFGAGPRNCVGMAMARLEAHLLLARALPRLRFAPVGPPPEPLGKITLRAQAPIRVRVSAR
jgi:cytochrome P450